MDEFNNISDLVTVPPANGAFYFLLRAHKNSDPMDLVRQLIERYKVAVIPGMTFGMQDKCYLRVAYGALHQDTAAEGIGRLVEGLKQIYTE